MEGFIDIEEYEGLYAIDRDGRIFSHRKHIFLKLHTSRNGYLRVTLKRDGKKKNKYLHRLIAATYLPTVKDKLFINHLDGNKRNNSLDNLQWCTLAENNEHAIQIGLAKPLSAYSR